jgi:glucose 1-dehydrogenase
MEQPLHGSIAIISGGIGDIGRAIARELSRRGARVALGDILPLEQATPLLLELAHQGCKARYDSVDVSNPEAVQTWIATVEHEVGVPNLIIPNAAIVTLKGIREVTAEEWQRELAINLSGAFYMAQAAANRLLAHEKPGRIVFTGSWAAETVHTSLPAYSVVKAGLRMLMRCMALDLAPAGILVNEVAPGYVDAGLTGRIFADFPERRTKAEGVVPVGHLISAEDVAWQVAHLCDPANRQMTGSVLLMDGGLSLVTPAGGR